MQRSGTTLLGRLLAQHPDAAGLSGTHTDEDEGQFVQDVYADDHRMGGPTRWAFHPQAHLTEQDVAESSVARDSLSKAWAPYVTDSDASVLIEKSPSNLTKTRWLRAVFPDSTFVVVTRHPAIQALAIQKWSGIGGSAGFGIEKRVDHWRHAMSTFRSDAAGLGDVWVVRYESLVAQPREVLDALAASIGLARFDFDVSSVRDQSSKYVDYWNAMRDAPRGWSHPPVVIGGFGFPGSYTGRRALSRLYWGTRAAADREIIARKYSVAAADWGYDVDAPGAVSSDGLPFAI